MIAEPPPRLAVVPVICPYGCPRCDRFGSCGASRRCWCAPPLGGSQAYRLVGQGRSLLALLVQGAIYVGASAILAALLYLVAP